MPHLILNILTVQGLHFGPHLYFPGKKGKNTSASVFSQESLAAIVNQNSSLICNMILCFLHCVEHFPG